MDHTYLFFGGNYSNLEATEALVIKARALGLPASNIICTGDMVAYCADGDKVAKLIRDWGIQVIQGNCEQSLADDSDDCGCGYGDGSTCSLLARNWYAHCQRTLSREVKDWFASLPASLTLEAAGQRLYVCHGTPASINRYVFASSDEETWQTLFDEVDADIVVCGHSGLPFTHKHNRKIWHNAGALGMPANDGTARVWYSVVTLSPGVTRLSHLPLTYHHALTQQKMRAAGLPEGYCLALETGLWPSLDTLTPHEQAQTGHPLTSHTYSFSDRLLETNYDS